MMMTQGLVLASLHLSLVNALLMLAVFLLWGKWMTKVDKDAKHFFLPFQKWNAYNLAAAFVGLLVWVCIPLPGSFYIGLVLVPAGLIALAMAYIKVHNGAAPPDSQWDVVQDFIMKPITQRKEKAAAEKISIQFWKNGYVVKSPQLNDPDYEIHLMFEEIILAAIRKKAQAVQFAFSESNTAAQLEIDGVGHAITDQNTRNMIKLVDYLKEKSEMDVADRRKKQRGNCEFESEEFGRHKLMLTSWGSTRSFNCDIQIDPTKQKQIAVEDLGFDKRQLEHVKKLTGEDEQNGVVLVAAFPKSGVTTTMAALISEHDPYTTEIQTVEKDITLEIEGVKQNTIYEEGLASTIEETLLSDPSVLLVEKLTDQQSAIHCAEAAHECRIYAGIEAADAMTAVQMWLKTIPDPEVAAQSLRAIISPRLIRKLCDVCKMAYTPDAESLAKLGLPEGKVNELYKSTGHIRLEGQKEKTTCPNCGGIGYSGRTGIFEVMYLDDDARAMIATNNLNGLKTHLRKQRMSFLQQAALTKVINGTTSISEVMRAIGNKK